MTDGTVSGAYTFASIDIDTGLATAIFNFTPTYGISAMAYHPGRRKFIALGQTGAAPPYVGKLLEIDATNHTFVAREITGLPNSPFTNYLGIEYDPTQTLGRNLLITYGQDPNHNLQNRIAAVDPASGVVLDFTEPALAVSDFDSIVFDPATSQAIDADSNNTPFEAIADIFGPAPVITTYATPGPDGEMYDPACSPDGTMYLSRRETTDLWKLNSTRDGYDLAGPHLGVPGAWAVGLAFGPEQNDCHPTCVNYDPLTDTTTVTNCDCGGANACQATVPEPGTGPPTCVIGCPFCETCQHTEIINPDGSIDICCGVTPTVPDPVAPNSFGTCTSNNVVCQIGGPACTQGTCDRCGQVRYISFEIPASSAGSDTAIRVKLVSLHHPVSPAPGGTPNFAAFESQLRYLNTVPGALSHCCVPNPTGTGSSTCNPSVTCTSDADCAGLGANTKCEKNLCPDAPGFKTFFRCARLGCTPEYRDWAADFSSLYTYVYGDSVVPDSAYQVAHLGATCAGNEAACAAASAEVSIATERWGNVDCSTSVVPSAQDIGFVVSNVKGAAGAFIEPRCMLRDATPNPLGLAVNAQDIGREVDAVKGLPYPFTISACP